jgi:hypothetical protein
MYRLYDRDGVLIYAGISNLPHLRWNWHAENQPWWHEVVTREIEWFDTRALAEAAEARCISASRPRYNTDWGFPDRKPIYGSSNPRKGWTPDQTFHDLFARHEADLQAAAQSRDEIEAEIARVMWTGVSASRIAKFTTWRTPTIQAIGKKFGVPLLRKPTVVSINAPADDA